MSKTRILYLFTRTPLHVGAGASVGAIDQPVQRERHTGFPIIPASSLKGSFADQWPTSLKDEKGRMVRVLTEKQGETTVIKETSEAAWLYGFDAPNHAAAGALLFGEARLLAFPIRSAKGSFAWITSPLLLRRAARDGVLTIELVEKITSPTDEQAIYDGGAASPLDVGGRVVLEEYTFTQSGPLAEGLSRRFAELIQDAVWKEVASRLVIVSDGMMSFFAQNACEVAQHVRISDETGTAEGGALFNQENVPSETVFYAVLAATGSRLKANGYADKTAEDALNSFAMKLTGDQPFQFGGDASTGLGYCTVKLV